MEATAQPATRDTATSALCSPESLLQGHAAWHLLCAGATVCLYGYALSEREPTGE